MEKINEKKLIFIDDITNCVNEQKSEMKKKIVNDIARYLTNGFKMDDFYNLLTNYQLNEIFEIIIRFFSGNNYKAQYYLDKFLNQIEQLLSEKSYALNIDLTILDLFLGDLYYLETFHSLKVPDERICSLREKINEIGTNINSDNAIQLRCWNDEKSFEDFCYMDAKNIEKDQIFGVRAIDLLTLNFYEKRDGEDSVAWYIAPSSLINTSPILKNTLLMFINLGDNKAMEYYTGKIVNLELNEEDKMLVNKSYSDVLNLVEPLSRLKESPFVLYANREKNQFFTVDDKFKLEFAKQDEEIVSKIKAVIEVMEDHYKNKLNEKLELIYARDYEIAQKINVVETEIIELKQKAKNYLGK